MRARAKELSAINPKAYADRFLKFTKNTVIPNIEAKLDKASKSNYISSETTNLINLFKRRLSHDQLDDSLSQSDDSSIKRASIGASALNNKFEQVFEDYVPQFNNNPYENIENRKPR